jgi:hypothetical protein
MSLKHEIQQNTNAPTQTPPAKYDFSTLHRKESGYGISRANTSIDVQTSMGKRAKLR